MDNYSLKPIAPTLEAPEQDEDDVLLDAKDNAVAQAYFHPAWVEVEQRFIDEIEKRNSVATIPDNLPADEFKIEALSNQKCRAFLIGVLEEVKNAVNAVESAKGGK